MLSMGLRHLNMNILLQFNKNSCNLQFSPLYDWLQKYCCTRSWQSPKRLQMVVKSDWDLAQLLASLILQRHAPKRPIT